MSMERLSKMAFAAVYPAYIAKAEKKGRSQAEVDTIIRWQTGYDQATLEARLADRTDFTAFFANAPAPNPKRMEVSGLICGHRVEEIVEPLPREIRILDKLIDELARGRPMAKILR